MKSKLISACKEVAKELQEEENKRNFELSKLKEEIRQADEKRKLGDMCICYRNLGCLTIGDIVFINQDGEVHKKIINDIYNPNNFSVEYVTTVQQIYSNFIEFSVGDYTYIYFEKIVNKGWFFGKETETFDRELKCNTNDSHINEIYIEKIVLPLLLIKKLEEELLYPFSYLITTTLDTIKKFSSLYIESSSERDFITLLVDSGHIIEEIKNECLALYNNTFQISDEFIEDCNKRTQLMVEAKELKKITTSFFKDMNRDIVTIK